MPICSLDPVRLMDASVAAGFQLRFPDDQAAIRGIALLPELIHRMEAALERDYPMVRLSAEIESVCMRERLRILLRHGLNVRLRFPAYAQAADAKAVCDEVQGALQAALNAGNVPCAPVRSAEDGTLCRIPQGRGLSLCVLTKERIPCHPLGGGTVYYSPRLSGALPANPAAVFAALRQAPGCGFSLQIAAAHDPSLCAALVRCAAQLPAGDPALPELMDIAQAGAYYISQAVAFAPDRDACSALAGALGDALGRGGIAHRAWPLPEVDELQRYQLLYDPWALNDWINGQIGGRLAFTASLMTPPELDALSAAPADVPVPPAETAPVAHSQDDVAGYLAGFHLSAAELSGFGVKSEDELPGFGLSQEQLGNLRTASCLAHIALSRKDTPSLDFYIAPSTTLYESLLRAFFYPRLMEPEEILREQTTNYVRRPGETNLSYFDFISFPRVRNFTEHATLDGQRYPFAFWSVMLNCFKCVRLLRNKVSHGSAVRAEREEFTHVYKLLYLPGAAHKLEALRYAIDHPHPNADDGNNRNLKILQPDNRLGVEDLLTFVENNPALFEESLFSFIVRCGRAQWE